MEVRIRRASLADAPRVTQTFRESRAGSRGLIPPSRHTIDEDEWFVTEVLIRKRETWIAVFPNGDVGAMMTLDGEWLDQLYVNPTVTRSGLGTALLEIAKRERPGGLQLWSFRTNTRAQQFYEKHGFVAVEETDGSRNEDHAPDIRYQWGGLVTLATAQRLAGELVAERYPGELLDLAWDREYTETTTSWVITVNTLRFYMTRLERHRLVPDRFVVVPKDGSAPTVAASIEGEIVDAMSLDDPRLFARLPDRILFQSQPAEVWRQWLPRLRYFHLEVSLPRDDARDTFVARIRCMDEVDAQARLTRIRADDPEVRALFVRSRTWRHGTRTGFLRFDVRGTDNQSQLTAADFERALTLEARFDALGWADDRDDEAPPQQAITRERYPDLFG